MKVIGYVRLSKKENGHGISVQRNAIEDFCERRQLELVRIEEDDGASGRTVRKRPGLAAAIEACRSKDAEGIVATRVDRLARSSLDFHKTIEQLQRANATVLFSEQESFSLDTPEGRMLVGILATFAAFEADLISARTKAALAVAKRDGKKLGNPRLRPAPAKLAARIQAMSAEGLSLRKIAETLNEDGVPTLQGGKSWQAQTVSNILKRADAKD